MSAFGADIARYRARGYRGRELWLNPAVWSIACYRLAQLAACVAADGAGARAAEGGVVMRRTSGAKW